MRLIVIPSDNIIIKDGKRLVFQFAAPADLHAIQWYGTHGFVETTDGKQVRIDSLTSVQAYIDAYGAEVARLAAIEAQPPTQEELDRAARRNEIVQARADTKADAFVRQFVDMNPGQVTAYVNSNVSNLADAKQLMTKILLMMLAIAKEQYK